MRISAMVVWSVLGLPMAAQELVAQELLAPYAGERVAPPLDGSSVSAPVDVASIEPGLLIDAPLPDTTWVLADRYKACVTAEGLLFHALPGVELPLVPVRLALDQVTVGGEELPLAEARKRPDEGQVCVLDHGALREHFDLRREGVEQSFHFDRLPARGELVLTIRAETKLEARAERGGVQFGDGPQGVRYGAAVAFDRAGRRCELPSTWCHGALQITVPADFVAEAQLPLVVDPLVSPSRLVATGAGTTLFPVPTQVGSPDVSFDPVAGRWLVVWMWFRSSSDRDVFARTYDSSWVATGPVIPVDITTTSWSTPSVAYRGRNAEWLVVAETPGTSWGIVARRVPTSGVALPAFSIVSGWAPPFGVSRPCVGGDPYAGADPAVSIVAFEHRGILRYCTIDETGVVGPLIPLVPGVFHQSLSLSRSNRTDNWALVWAERGPATGGVSTEVVHRLAMIDFTGALVPLAGGAFVEVGRAITSSSALPAFETSVTSPDLRSSFTVVYRDVGMFGQTVVRRVASTGSLTAPTLLSALAPGWGSPTTYLETDGVRTLAVKMEGNGVRGVLLATDPATGVFTSHDDFVTTGTVATRAMAVTSAYAASVAATITPFTIATGHLSSTQSRVQLVGYRGHSPAPGFTTVFTACGLPLTIQHGSVLPALGNTVTVNLLTSHPQVGFLFGRPTWVPLTGMCPCGLGVDGVILPGPVATFSVPLDVQLVGQHFAIQGFTMEGGLCFSGVSYSNTIDMRIL
jgi:hypothetical protein